MIRGNPPFQEYLCPSRVEDPADDADADKVRCAMFVEKGHKVRGFHVGINKDVGKPVVTMTFENSRTEILYKKQS
jgi:hypothetical protein